MPLFKRKQLPYRTKPLGNAPFLLASTILLSDVTAAQQGNEELRPKKGGYELEEIIVTARKREENLMETPISVTAFSQDDLEIRNLNNISEVANYTPNLLFDGAAGNSGSSSGGNVFIRGVGQIVSGITFDPGVGIYLDGVYIARTLGNVSEVAGIERMEVLRGPQGTLFGKNTIGGALNIVSAKPAEHFGGNVEAVVGRYERQELHASADIPLVGDTLLAKVSGSVKDREGFGKRPLAGDRMGDENSRTGRVQLLWRASDNLELLFAADATNKNDGSAVQSSRGINTDAPVLSLWNLFAAPLFGDTYDEKWLTSDPYVSNGTAEQFGDADIWGTSLTVDWDLGNVAFKSITAYRDSVVEQGYDGDHSPLPVFDTFGETEQDQFSQEFQVFGDSFDGDLNWLAGAYYFTEKGRIDTEATFMAGLFEGLEALPAAILPLAPGVSCPAPFPSPCLGGPGNPFNIGFDLEIDSISEITTDSYAVFGHASYKITDKLSATAGIRYTYEDKEYSTEQFRTKAGVFGVAPTDGKDNWEAFSPKVGLEYQWQEDFMIYGSVAKGFKSGGFDANPLETGELSGYEPEFVTSYEIGLKAHLFDRRLAATAAAFYADYTDLQLTSIGVSDQGNVTVIIENAGEARIKGFEFELLARPIQSLNINLGVGYTDADYTDLNDGVSIQKGDEFVKTPEWTINAGVQYAQPVKNYGDLIFRTDYSFRSGVFSDFNNTPESFQNSYALVNASVGYVDSSGEWEVSVFGTNLTDEVYQIYGISALDSVGFAQGYYGRPREWGFKLKYLY